MTPRALPLGLALLASGCTPEVDDSTWFIEVEVEDRSLWADDHRAWQLEVRLDSTLDHPSREQCPVQELIGARLNGETATFSSGGTYGSSGWASSGCRRVQQLWTFTAPPDAVELDLDRFGTFELDVPLHTVSLAEPADAVVGFGDRIELAVEPPLEEDAVLDVTGTSQVRDPWPDRGCMSEADIDGGSIIGVADAFTDPRAAGSDETRCAVDVQIVDATIALEPCALVSCSVNEMRQHIEVLEIAEGAFDGG